MKFGHLLSESITLRLEDSITETHSEGIVRVDYNRVAQSTERETEIVAWKFVRRTF